ncbi:MAG TPA: nucleotidyltransferase family protein [Candidatus Sulfopaludibacter sp.]|nr:nucleotidyltransferase family protein [Candidatus Sulfopaludibacter sp.]
MRRRIKKAMVLAAGYGTRLKPLTDRVPKPLVPVAGKPMIQYALDKLEAYGVEEVVINVSHLKGQLTAWLAGNKNLAIKISEEAEPLETGGGLKKALRLLGDDPVFIINSDIIWMDELPSLAGAEEGGQRPDEGRGAEAALDRLARHWDKAKMDFLLLVQSKARAVGHEKGEDHLFIKSDNTIGWNEKDAPYIIAGIGIFHPRVLRDAPDGKFSVKILWHQALAQNRLFCLPHHGHWFQTGTLADIKKAEEYLASVKP